MATLFETLIDTMDVSWSTNPVSTTTSPTCSSLVDVAPAGVASANVTVAVPPLTATSLTSARIGVRTGT